MAENLTFQGENVDESIIFVLRRHLWMVMKTGLVVVILLLLVTLTLMKYQGSWITSWVIFLLLPLCLYLAARAWFMWSNSVYVLTNERILAVEQSGWFDRTVKEIQLRSIITINHHVGGPIATMLNFGTINILASGADEPDMTMTLIFDPYEVQQRIVQAKRGVRAKGASPDADGDRQN